MSRDADENRLHALNMEPPWNVTCPIHRVMVPFYIGFFEVIFPGFTMGFTGFPLFTNRYPSKQRNLISLLDFKVETCFEGFEAIFR